MKILNRFNKEVIFETEVNSIKALVIKANNNGINLSGADLRGADLRGADLRGANLRVADLSGADLRGANLYGANLSGANLYGANLSGADLDGADLYGADLDVADLYGANLSGAKNIHSFQCGELNRVCFAIKHETKVMFQLGCFWGDKDEAIEKIRTKYGEKSSYEKLVKIYNKMLGENK